jgi:phosphatidylinositol alpha-1,6-mannosyltransferase
LVPKNGVDILIKALKSLPADIKLLIVGDGPLRRSLELQATSYQLQARISFCGFIPQKEIPDYLASADVFARLSRSEGQGISFLEAFAAGLPVVATAVGGITDFLRDKETGLFAENENPEDAARKILILLRDEAIRQKVIENARKLVAEKYDWDKLVVRIKSEVFDKINGDVKN